MKPEQSSFFMNTLLVLFSLGLAVGACEVFLRIQKHMENTVSAQFPVYARNIEFRQYDASTPGTVYGSFAPNSSFIRTIYNEKGELKQRNNVSINNFGWISRYDYQLQKEPDEFRIAMIGDSFTGTTTNERVWSDTVQDALNKDKALLKAIGKKRVTVLNLGEAGAGLGYFHYPLSYAAYLFSSDLVIVNFITEDIFRRHHFPDFAPPDPRNIDSALMGIKAKEQPIQRLMEFDGVKVPVFCDSYHLLVDCSAHEWTIPSNKDYAPEAINTIKRAVANELSWNRTIASDRLFLLDFLKQSAPEAMSSALYQEDVEASVAALKAMRAYLPDMMIAHVPTYNEMHPSIGLKRYVKHLHTTSDSFYNQLEHAGFTVNQMAHWMPVQHDAKEVIHWYNLPHDGHWSDKGADLYAAAMHQLIRTRFLPNRKLACAEAFSQFIQAKALLKQDKSNEASAVLSRAMKRLPQHADAHYASAKTYAECGFLVDLYIHQANTLLHNDQGNVAKDFIRKGLALSPDHPALNTLILKAPMSLEEKKGVIELMVRNASLIEDINLRVPALLEAAEAAAESGLDSLAKMLYTQVNTQMPNHFPALVGLADIHLSHGDHQQAAGYLQAAIAQQPDNMELKEKLTQTSLPSNP